MGREWLTRFRSEAKGKGKERELDQGRDLSLHSLSPLPLSLMGYFSQTLGQQVSKLRARRNHPEGLDAIPRVPDPEVQGAS